MKDTAIDPSEILIDAEGAYQETSLVANPWVRFLARMFDYALFFLILDGIRSIIGSPLPFDHIHTFFPLEYALWIPVESLLLWVFKTTPGKWWFRISLAQGRAQRLEFITLFRRSVRIWIRGIGLGIPIINGLCMMVAYHRLKLFQMTSWDCEDHIHVTNQAINQTQMIIGSIIAIFGLLSHFY